MYKFIIDTDQYAGNFEREMCAYLTGVIGECGVGEEFAELFLKEEGKNLFDNIKLVPDEGCYRPCAIEPNPQWFNTGMGNSYKKDSCDKNQILKDHAESVRKYEEPLIASKQNIKQKLLNGEKVQNWTVEACDREILNHQKRIEDAENRTEHSEYSAYNSVAIFFDSCPTKEQINIMKRRAQNFAAAKREIEKQYSWKNFQLTIEGFRLREVMQTEKEEAV